MLRRIGGARGECGYGRIAGAISASLLLVAAVGVSSLLPAEGRPRDRTVFVALAQDEYVSLAGGHDRERGWLDDRRARRLVRSGIRFRLFDRRGFLGTVVAERWEPGDEAGGWHSRLRPTQRGRAPDWRWRGRGRRRHVGRASRACAHRFTSARSLTCCAHAD